MLIKYEISYAEAEAIWSTISITKEDVLNISECLLIKKEHEAVNIISSSELLFQELSLVPKDLSLQEFTDFSMTSPKLSSITYGDIDVALPLYKIYSRNLSEEDMKLCFYILANKNQTLNRLFNTDKHKLALLGETLFNNTNQESFTFLSSNPHFLEQNNLQGKNLTLSFEEKESLILNLPIQNFLNNHKDFIQHSKPSSTINNNEPNHINMFHKNINFFSLAQTTANDKEFVKDFLNLFVSNPYENSLHTNKQFITAICSLLKVNENSFPKKPLNHSLLKQFTQQFFLEANKDTLQDPDIASILLNNFSSLQFLSFKYGKNIQQYLLNHFSILTNTNNQTAINHIFSNNAQYISVTNSDIHKVQLKSAKHNTFYLLEYILPEIEQFYKSEETDIDSFLTPSKKAIKDYLLLTFMNHNHATASHDINFLMMILFTISSKEEQEKNHHIFLNLLCENNFKEQFFTLSLIDMKEFLKNNHQHFFKFVNLDSIQNIKASFVKNIQLFNINPEDKSTSIGKLYFSNLINNLLVNEFKTWFTHKDVSKIDLKFIGNLSPSSQISDGFNHHLKDDINFSNLYLEKFYSNLSQELKDLSTNDFKLMFDSLASFIEIFKNSDDSQINNDIKSLGVYSHYFFKKCFPEKQLHDILDLNINKYLNYTMTLPKYLTPFLFSPKILKDFDINDENNKESFKSFIKHPSVIDGINENFHELQHLKPFFLDINNIIHNIPSTGKTPLSDKKLYLGKIYTKADLEALFKEMGNNYSWIKTSPFTFTIKAPQNVKNNPAFWSYIIKHLSAKPSILNNIPLNMIQDPQVISTALEVFGSKAATFSKYFPSLDGLTTEKIMKILDNKNNALDTLKKISPSVFNNLVSTFSEDSEAISNQINKIIMQASTTHSSSKSVSKKF